MPMSPHYSPEERLVVAASDIVSRLRKRAEIRRQIKDRKSVREGKPDRIADLLEEAAAHIEKIEFDLILWKDIGTRFTRTPGK